MVDLADRQEQIRGEPGKLQRGEHERRLAEPPQMLAERALVERPLRRGSEVELRPHRDRLTLGREHCLELTARRAEDAYVEPRLSLPDVGGERSEARACPLEQRG